MARLAAPAAIAAALLAFIPWGSASVRILGVWSPGLDFKGTEIGSGLGVGVEAGWIVAALAVAALFAKGARVPIAVVLLIYTAYNALTLAHHTLNITASATGEDVSNMIGARVSVGFGAVAEVVAALVLVAGAIAGRRSVAASAVESAVELEPS